MNLFADDFAAYFVVRLLHLCHGHPWADLPGVEPTLLMGSSPAARSTEKKHLMHALSRTIPYFYNIKYIKVRFSSTHQRTCKVFSSQDSKVKRLQAIISSKPVKKILSSHPKSLEQVFLPSFLNQQIQSSSMWRSP